MYEERYAKAISLGYKFLEEDDNGGAVYVKNGLKWIENYADLAKTLQKKQEDLLSFDDIEDKYKYNVDDYFFHNFQEELPSQVSLERQINWINNGLCEFENIFGENVNYKILNRNEYHDYMLVESIEIPFIFLSYDEDWELELYEAMKACRLDVRRSVKNALEQGYKYHKTGDNREFSPFMFRETDNSKWIHNIEKLKDKLNAQDFDELVKKDYNVDDYYLFNLNGEEALPREYLEWVFVREILIPKVSEIISTKLIGKKLSRPEIEEILEEFLQEKYNNYDFSKKTKDDILRGISEIEQAEFFID